MKKLMTVAVMAIFALTANAQKTLRDVGTFTVQPKVGLALGAFSGAYSTGSKTDTKMRTGFLAGVEGEYYVADWFSAAFGFNYAQQGWKISDDGGNSTTKLDYMNIPIVANFYVAKGLALKAGIQVGFLMNAKQASVDIKDGCKKVNFAIPVGISYEYADIVLDARYNIAVTKVNKDGDDWGIFFLDASHRSDLIQITLGYKFEL